MANNYQILDDDDFDPEDELRPEYDFAALREADRARRQSGNRGDRVMEKMKKYRQLLKQILEGYSQVSVSVPNEGIERLLITDEEHGNFMLMRIGWHGQKRVEWTTVFARVKDSKIWIEKDLTEDGITSELLEAGVPKEDIVLAFHAPELRQYTEFATA